MILLKSREKNKIKETKNYMKPEKLIMNAFGPFSTKQEIDFSKLAESGMFLITGPTGSGKTTIFDALTFALYGTASGDARQSSSFKSDHADIGELCYVELSFYVNGKRYVIRRQPTQNKLGRGDKLISVGESVSLLLPDNIQITGGLEVKKLIDEIMGINEKQFKQIVMLAQGEFKKLLEAPSKEKKEIFRRIFDTDIYKKLNDKLKQKNDELYSQMTLCKTKISAACSMIESRNDELTALKMHEHIDFDVVYKLLSQEIDSVSKDINALDIQIKENDNDLKKINIDLAIEINNKFTEMDKLIEEEKRLELIKQEIHNKRTILDNLKKAEKIKVIDDKINNRKSEFDKNSANIEKLSFDLDSAEIHYNKTISEREAILKSSETVSLLFSKANELSAELVKSKSYFKLESDCKENQKEREALRNKLSVAKALFDLAVKREGWETNSELIANLNAISDYQRLLMVAKNELSALIEQYHNKYEAFIKSGAYVLSKELKEGVPCPVCGSVHHPDPASRDENYPSKQEVDDLNSLCAQKEKECFELSHKIDLLVDGLKKSGISPHDNIHKWCEDKLSALYMHQDELYKAISEGEKQIGGIISSEDIAAKSLDKRAGVVSLIDKISAKLEALENVHAKYEEELKIYESGVKIRNPEAIECELKETDIKRRKIQEQQEIIEKNISDSISLISDLKGQIKSLKNANEIMKAEIIESEKSLTKLLGEYGFDDISSCRRHYDDFSKIEVIEKEVNDYDIRIKICKDRLNALDFELIGKQRSDIEKLKEIFEEKIQKGDELLKQINKLELLLTNNKNCRQQIEKEIKHYRKIEDEYYVIAELYRLSNGDNAANVPFENYVLASYFNDIISAANLRFSKMTNSRYQMKRREEKEKYGRQSGLDIEIIDNYTGKERHVNTLSGGESFEASLSLALGLADIIQSYCGGIKIETMFIDEGFGTLDAQSLDTAISTLMSLRGSGILIGIISHVSELKEKVKTQIEIVTSKGGSTLVIKE